MILLAMIRAWYQRQLAKFRYPMDFYITALNTFDGGPPGVFGEKDAIKITEALLREGKAWLKKKRLFKCMSTSRALAQSFALMAKFWLASAKHLEEERGRHQREKQRYIALLLENNVPIPLSFIYRSAGCQRMQSLGIETLQRLMCYIEEYHRFPGEDSQSHQISFDPSIAERLSENEKQQLQEKNQELHRLLNECVFIDLGLSKWLSQHISSQGA